MFLRRVTPLLCVVAVLTACGAGAAETDSTAPSLEVGELPEPSGATVAPSDSSIAKTTTTLSPEDQIGALSAGNRVILIGDSVMASTSRRYSNDMCNALVPLGWQVEVDAETGRFVTFGNDVLDSRLDAGWDASVILLGNNYREDQDGYRKELEQMVRRLSPQPVVLLTVTEFTPSRAEVNEVVFEMAAKYDNVLVVDWATTTADDPSLTGADGLHLTTAGREALAQNVALALGVAPEQPGKCLTTDYTDDSSGPVEGTTTSVSGRPSRSTTTTDGGSDTTSPPVTDPPATDPPTTPASAPPVSAPPVTV
ncbi:MAG: hypothetical protein RL238_2682 [Actinomycetota bacterium]|jgi:hypothetical protein